MTPGQMRDLISAVDQGIPTELTFKEAQYFIGSKGMLQKKVEAIFREKPPNTFSSQIAQWEKFYHVIFHRNYDFTKLVVPDAPSSYYQMVCVPQELTTDDAFSEGKRQQNFYKPTVHFLESLLNTSCRADRFKDTYIILCAPAKGEAWSIFEKSDRDPIGFMTLREYLLLERFLFWKADFVPEERTEVLCAGSRNKDGTIPAVESFQIDLNVNIKFISKKDKNSWTYWITAR